MSDIKYNADLPSSHYCSRDARVRASRKKEKKEKRREKAVHKFEANAKRAYLN